MTQNLQCSESLFQVRFEGTTLDWTIFERGITQEQLRIIYHLTCNRVTIDEQLQFLKGGILTIPQPRTIAYYISFDLQSCND